MQIVIESTIQNMAIATTPLRARMKSFACLSGQMSSVLGRHLEVKTLYLDMLYDFTANKESIYTDSH